MRNRYWRAFISPYICKCKRKARKLVSPFIKFTTVMIRPDLNEEWFQKILRESDRDESLYVEKVEMESAVEPGNNFVSDVQKVIVDGYKIVGGKKIDYSTSLIAKLSPQNKLAEKTNFRPVFRNEKIAYFEIIPELEKYTIGGRLPVPKCYHADERTIVLQDLTPLGYQNVDKTEDFSVEQSKLVLEKLAKLHAASILLGTKDPSTLTALSQKLRDLTYDPKHAIYQNTQYMPIKLAIRLFETLEPTQKNRGALYVLRKLKVDYVQRIRDIVLSERPFRVFNHGDTWGNNILFNGNDVMLIDLQVMRFASVAADLSYFLYINMKPSDRRDNYNALLYHYLDHLNSNIRNRHEMFTFAWLKQEMDDFAIVGFASSIWLMPVFYYDKDDLNMDNYSEDKQENLEWHWSKCNDNFKERLKETVLEFVDNNDFSRWIG